ncbi:MAG TPA: class I SAM-dependent methyltransferase [Thermoanaerobaculia bacterium]
MLAAAKRLVRRWVPRLTHPLLDAAFRDEPRDAELDRTYRDVVSGLEPEVASDPFVMNRYFEGRRWREVVRHSLDTESLRLLDVGAGNGAIELAVNATADLHAFSVEREWNRTASAIHAAVQVPFRRTIADARSLPFGDGAFDGILCLETIEHVREAAQVGRELSRVLRMGGIILVTTPPRWRYALAPDPHFAIPGLALLPHAWQRSIAHRRGYTEAHHHVEKLFGSISEIARLFPACRVEEVLSRSRAPKRWFWDAILLRRIASPAREPAGQLI